MNKVILMGRIVKDIELKQTQSNIAVCEFTIAVNRKYDRNKTDFIGCRAWRSTAEFISRYFHKGDMIAVVGAIEIDEWEDKDGKRQHKTKVNVEEAEFCGSKPKEQSTESTGFFDDFGSNDDGELPFN